MVEYLAVAFAHPSGGWVAVLPDFVGVTGRGADMDRAIERAALAAQDICATIVALKKAMPEPGDLASARGNLRWTREYGIDWERATVRAVPIQHPSSAPRRRAAKRESKVVAWSRRMAARADRIPEVGAAAE